MEPRTRAPIRVGLIGLGSVGRSVVRALAEKPVAHLELVGALIRETDRARPDAGVPIMTSLDALLATRPDVVVEAAGHAALQKYSEAVLRGGCDLLIVSAGALADDALYDAIRRAAADGPCARVVSGAIGGLDALAAAAEGGLDRVEYRARKPARSLLAPEEASQLVEPLVIFRGTARVAVRRFPESVNVAAAVSLAGIGFDRTEVTVIADPTATRNHHEIIAEGAFGSLRCEIAGIPSAENPRTARLVAMSVVHALRSRTAPFGVG